jgi:hypothetical protein
VYGWGWGRLTKAIQRPSLDWAAPLACPRACGPLGIRLHADGGLGAASAREALEELGASGDPFALLARVEAVCRAHWALLDGLSGAEADRGAVPVL